MTQMQDFISRLKNLQQTGQILQTPTPLSRTPSEANQQSRQIPVPVEVVRRLNEILYKYLRKDFTYYIYTICSMSEVHNRICKEIYEALETRNIKKLPKLSLPEFNELIKYCEIELTTQT
ncbi:MAG: hypothetical protein QXM12_03160 [Nitrososphaerota archaeon]